MQRYILISFSFLTILCLSNRAQAQNQTELSRTPYYPFFTEGKGWSFVNLEGRFLGEYFDSIHYTWDNSDASLLYKDGLLGVFNLRHHTIHIPCEYSSIEKANGSYIAKKHENNQPVLHLYFKDSIKPKILPYNEVYQFRKEDYSSFDLVRLKEPSFPNEVYRSRSFNSHDDNYIASRNYGGYKKMGIVTNLGLEKVPIIYDDIEIYKKFFFVMKLDGLGNKKIGVLYENGLELFPVIYDSIEWVGENFSVIKRNQNGTYSQDIIPIDWSKMESNYQHQEEIRLQKEKEEREKHFIPAFKEDGYGRYLDYVINTHTKDTIFRGKGDLYEVKVKKFDKDLFRQGRPLIEASTFCLRTKVYNASSNSDLSHYEFVYFDTLGIKKLTIKDIEHKPIYFFQYIIHSSPTHDIIVDLEKLTVIYNKRAWRNKHACKMKKVWRKYSRDFNSYTDSYEDWDYRSCTGSYGKTYPFSPQFYFFSENGEINIGFAFHNERQGWCFADMDGNVRRNFRVKNHDLWSITYDYANSEDDFLLSYGYFVKPIRTENILIKSNLEIEENRLINLNITNLNSQQGIINKTNLDFTQYDDGFQRLRHFHHEKGMVLRFIDSNAYSYCYYFTNTDTLLTGHFNRVRLTAFPPSYLYKSFAYVSVNYHDSIHKLSGVYKNLNHQTLFEFHSNSTQDGVIILDSKSNQLHDDHLYLKSQFEEALFKTSSGFALMTHRTLDKHDNNIVVFFVDSSMNYKVKEYFNVSNIGKDIVDESNSFDFRICYGHDGTDILFGHNLYENATWRIEFMELKYPIIVVQCNGKEYWHGNGSSQPYFTQEIK